MIEAQDAATIPAVIAEAAERFGDHAAVVDGERSVSYRELDKMVRLVARAYLAHGVRPGDRVAVWAPNRLEFILAVVGAQSIGAAVVPINTRYSGREAHVILGRSGASILVVADGFLGLNLSASLNDVEASAPSVGDGPVAGLPKLKDVVVLDGIVTDPGKLSWAAFLADGESITESEARSVAAAVSPENIADILFTSGTTGVPKGVMSAHRQTLGVARDWARGAELTPDDRYAIVNPFFHGFGYKAGMISSLVSGATIYPVATFNTDTLLELIQSARITVLPGVSTIFTSLIDHPRLREYDLSSLRFAIAGAATVPATLFHDMVNLLGFRRVAQAYGLTECVVATLSRPNEGLEHASQTTGPAVPGMEIRVVDPECNDLPVGGDGEILLRGANVMLGYFEDEAATSAAIDADGWFRTGDIGQLDEHGCLKITDRLKDMFTVGGFNVYPAEVEDILRRHPAVNESAVIGIDDVRLGSVGRAYIGIRHDAAHRPDAEELAVFCRSQLANFKVPREFVFLKDFPRNGTGKIMKSELLGWTD